MLISLHNNVQIANYNEQTVTSMQRSGLLLAGCSNAWKGKVPADREDGVLTASEI